MQKHKFIQFVVLTCILWVSAAFSQTADLYRLYVNNNIHELKSLSNAGRIINQDWDKFVKILFVEEMKDALPAYVDLYKSTSDQQLKKVILDRISQYYYAKGFYDTANRIMDDGQFRERIFSIKSKAIHFGVQIGAFSSYENALSSKRKFSDHLDEVFIVSKDHNNKKLYVVIAGKLDSQQEAVKLRDDIKRVYGHKGIVIQY